MNRRLLEYVFLVGLQLIANPVFSANEPCSKSPDINADGNVDAADNRIMLNVWGQCSDSRCDADLNCDGDIDVSDQLILLKDWDPSAQKICLNNPDLDDDGKVDIADKAILLSTWGSCKKSRCDADLNCDRTVDVNDLSLLLAGWGPIALLKRCSSVADLDNSGDIGVTDLSILLNAWGPCQKGSCIGDFDDSGDIGVTDLSILLNAWGPSNCNPLKPEPEQVSLIVDDSVDADFWNEPNKELWYGASMWKAIHPACRVSGGACSAAGNHWISPANEKPYNEYRPSAEGGVGLWENIWISEDDTPDLAMGSIMANLTHNGDKITWWGGTAAFGKSPDSSDHEGLADNWLYLAQVSNRLLDGREINIIGNTENPMVGYGQFMLPTGPREEDEFVGPYGLGYVIGSNNFNGIVKMSPAEAFGMLAINTSDNGYFKQAFDEFMIDHSAAHLLENYTSGVTLEVDSKVYKKIPAQEFSVDENSRTYLFRQYAGYKEQGSLFSKFDAIYRAKATGESPAENYQTPLIPTSSRRLQDFVNYAGEDLPAPDVLLRGNFNSDDGTTPFFKIDPNRVRWRSEIMPGEGDVFTPFLEWMNDMEKGTLPEYYKSDVEKVHWNSVSAEDLPDNVADEFNNVVFIDRLALSQRSARKYERAMTGYFEPPTDCTPVSSCGPHTAHLLDGSVLTYYWWKFIDQPIYKQFFANPQYFEFSQARKDALQATIEYIHEHWTIDEPIIPVPESLVQADIDHNQIVTPPPGMEFGYVPIVVKRCRAGSVGC